MNRLRELLFVSAITSLLFIISNSVCLADELIKVLIYTGRSVSIYGKTTGFRHFLSTSFPKGDIFISNPKDKIVYVNDNPYRGRIELLKRHDKLIVINIINIEDYLKGVLYNEVSHYWPMEVLKAQAVVARTYALYLKRHNTVGLYDLDSTQLYQVYRGVNAERYRLTVAVNETKGEVLVYNKKLFPAFYHSCCGGRTEYVGELWKINIPVLRSVKCRFCEICPYFNWTYTIAVSDFLKKIRSFGVYGSVVNDIRVSSYTKSGRVKQIEVDTDQGSYKILAKDLRLKIGSSLLRSTKFSIRFLGNKIVFKGKGWGHGVGMCQWGAYNMAKMGYNYRYILEFYYPGSSIINYNANINYKANELIE